MGAVKAHTWKELVEQAEITEKLAKKFKRSKPNVKWGVNNKGRGEVAQSSQSKGKESMSVGDSNLRKSIELKSHHIRGDFLLFWLQSQNSGVDQNLKFILEDKAFVGRIVNHWKR